MDKIWQLQDAKSHLSEVVKRAEGGEAQIITKHGDKVAVIIDYEHYLSLTGQHKTLLEVLRGEGPYIDELVSERDKSDSRDLSLT